VSSNQSNEHPNG